MLTLALTQGPLRADRPKPLIRRVNGIWECVSDDGRGTRIRELGILGSTPSDVFLGWFEFMNRIGL